MSASECIVCGGYVCELTPLLHVHREAISAALQSNNDITPIRHFGAGSLEARTGEGDTALHIAVREGLSQLCRSLLAAGADYDVVDGNGCVVYVFAPLWCVVCYQIWY